MRRVGALALALTRMVHFSTLRGRQRLLFGLEDEYVTIQENMLRAVYRDFDDIQMYFSSRGERSDEPEALFCGR